MSKVEKIGKPTIKDPESGTDIELGQPTLENEFEQETIEATFPVIKEAFNELYNKRANRGDKQIASMLYSAHGKDIINFAIVELKVKENSSATLALSIIESVRGELQFLQDVIESCELESEDSVKNQKLETERQKNFEQDLHYQEATDILFNHDKYKIPEKSDFIEWLSETKEMIKKLAKEEEERLRGAEEGENIGQHIFRSRLLTDVPAIERFEIGREITRDYREIMDLIQSRLLAERDKLGALVAQYVYDPKSGLKSEMTKSLVEIRKMELFLAMAEGERNERIAKKQP